MMKARCKQCKATMPNHMFDQHDCPAHVGEPRDGESWEAYKARSDKFTAQWREKNLK